MAVAALLLAVAAKPAAQSSTTRVVLATVVDPRNRPILDVGADDFVVTEGSAAREVLSVRVADYPIAVALDTRSEARADLPVIQQAARRFIERLGADRPAIVATLGRTPKPIVTFDDSRSTMFLRLAAMTPDAEGERPSFLTGIAASAAALHAIEPLFSAVVVLSSAPGEAGGAGETDPIADIIRSGAMVHAIVNQAAGAKGVNELRAVVTQTHGELTTIYSAASYQAALDRLVDRLSSELLVEYISPAGSKAADVKVGVRLPGARVRGLGVAPR